MPRRIQISLPSVHLVFIAAVYLTVVFNIAFFKGLATAFPVNQAAPFLVSVFIAVWAINALLLLPFSHRVTLKPAIGALVLLGSVASYFSLAYNVHFDATMVQNALNTNPEEAGDLITVKFIAYVLALGVLPVVGLGFVRLSADPSRRPLVKRMILAPILIVLIAVQVPLFSARYATFIREHKSLRYQILPAALLQATVSAVSPHFARTAERAPTARDAHVSASDRDRELLILVIGETARADRFSLNGYARGTNPQLAKESVISFKEVEACGTSTAVSVPCMFSIFDADGYSDSRGRETENLIDALLHAGIHVLWRDNNSNSRHVAGKVPYQDFKDPAINPVCDIECRDEGMLVGLQQYIDSQPKGDIVIVLHQMGNHGPAYYKRYPSAFERFTPVCKTAQLAECTRDEIGNAYDNAILYTDDFLAKVIALLKRYDRQFEAAMLYVSDHGESLGENGLWLHGMPRAFAPREQTMVPAIFWFGAGFEPADAAAVRSRRNEKISHHNLFHTVLGALEIDTHDYNPQLDLRRPLDGIARPRQ